MSSHVALTCTETAKAERIAKRLRISEHAQLQGAARLAFLGELDRLCRQQNNRLPIAVLRHVYRTRNSETACAGLRATPRRDHRYLAPSSMIDTGTE